MLAVAVTVLVLTGLIAISAFAIAFFFSDNSRRSIADVAFGQIAAIAAMAVSALAIPWPYLLGLTALKGFGLDPGELPDSEPLAIIGIVGIAGAGMVLVYRGWEKSSVSFEGPRRVSDEVSQFDPDRSPLRNLFAYWRAKIVLLLKKQRDYEIPGNPTSNSEFFEPDPSPVWTDFAKELVIQENSDILSDGAEWSGTERIWRLRQMDRLSGNSEIATRFILVVPVEHKIDLADAELRARQLATPGRAIESTTFVVNCDDHLLDTVSADGTTRVVSKTKLIANALQLGDYCRDLVSRYEGRPRITLSNGDGSQQSIALKDTFVDARVFEGVQRPAEAGAPSKSLNTILQNWTQSDSRTQLALLGEFGQGKTCAMLHYASAWARDYLRGDAPVGQRRIPLLIELRGYSPKSATGREGILNEWGGRYQLNGRALYNAVRAGMVVLIFEGFDEIKEGSTPADRIEQFKALWRFACVGSKLVFTGRPNFFWGSDEIDKVMRTSSAYSGGEAPNTSVYTLDYLKLDEISKALRCVPAATATGILELARRDLHFLNIAQRPSMLPVIVSQWLNISAVKSNSGTVSPATILSGYIASCYTRKEPEPGFPRRFQKVDGEIVGYLTKVVAVFMLANNQGNSITANQIEMAVEAIYPHLDEVWGDVEASAGARGSWQEFTRRAQEHESSGGSIKDKFRYLAHEVRANGILAPDPALGQSSFVFPHKQFFEFLCAEAYFGFAMKKDSKHDALRSLPSLPSLSRASTLEPMILYHFAMMASHTDIATSTPVSKYVKAQSGISGFERSIGSIMDWIIFSAQPWRYVWEKDGHRQTVFDKKNEAVVEFTFTRYTLERGLFEGFIRLLEYICPVAILSFCAFSVLDLARMTDASWVQPAIVVAFVTAILSGLAWCALVVARPGRRLSRFPLFVLARYRLQARTVETMFSNRIETMMLESAWKNSPHAVTSPWIGNLARN